MIILIIGAPFAGKTTLLKELSNKGVKVFHTDSYITEIYKPGGIGFNKIVEEFGNDYVLSNGVNRKLIKEKIIKDENFLFRLNELIHPLIKEKLNGKNNYVAELPIMSNSPIKFNYDKVVLVKANKKILKNRIEQKMGMKNEEFINYIISKWDNNIKADIIVDTSNGIESEKIEEIIQLVNK